MRAASCPRPSDRRAAAALLALVSLAALPAHAADIAELSRCQQITDPVLRLPCYDAAMQGADGQVPVLLGEAAPAAASERSTLGERWSIGVPARDSRFDLRPHRPSYLLLGRYSDAPNTLPGSPSKPALAEPVDVQNVEAKFQVSFKVKLADFIREFGGAVWAGYTQQSQWQVYNGATSRPFRETNYEPELMLALHPDREILGWRWRLLMVGLNHQSNGRSEPLSRSWNRVVAQVGIERGKVALLLRPWWRITEDDARDDNPDITRYLGHGELVVQWSPSVHTVSLGLRGNLRSGKAAGQAGWTFPLARRVRGTLQLFSGYGESLIDYNVRQNTIGLGISLADHL